MTKDNLFILFIIAVFCILAYFQIANLVKAKKTGIIKVNAFKNFSLNRTEKPTLFKATFIFNILVTIFYVLLALFIILGFS
jgi:hypothetical protein